MSSPLIITEGEKKSLSLSEHVGPSIGLTGVWNWAKGRSAEQKETIDRHLIDDLMEIEWSGRLVFIVFDYDSRLNPQVELAQLELARVLERMGAHAIVRSLDSLAWYGKGVDDILGADPSHRQLLQDLIYEGVSVTRENLTDQKVRSLKRPGIYFSDAPPGDRKDEI